MAQSSAQRDPSMEEILASIRRIIEEGEEARKPAETHGEFEPTVIGPAANDALRRPIPPAPVLRKDVPAVETVEAEAFSRELDVSETGSTIGGGTPNDSFLIDNAVDEFSLTLDDFTIDLDEVQDIERKYEPAPQEDETAAAIAKSDVVPASIDLPVPEAVTLDEPDLKLAQPEPQRPSDTEPNPAPQVRLDALDAPTTGYTVAEKLPTVQIAATMVRAQRKANTIAQAPNAVKTAESPPETQKADQKSPILSHVVERQVTASFIELNEALVASRSRSLDQLAEDMLRPMLQDWLDNNLPTLVERLVREEIERVARGAA